MTTTNVLHRYDNGNTSVTLFSDGSKEREWLDGEEPSPEYPESVDLKITDYCGAFCKACHESSSRRGVAAPTDRVIQLIRDMKPGSEVAIGGGDPLTHPYLIQILAAAKERGVVANLTVNARHCGPATPELRQWLSSGLIHGLGISYCVSFSSDIEKLAALEPEAVVLHLIAGVDRPKDLLLARQLGAKKFLVLGYKRHGRGLKVDEERLAKRLGEWRYWVSSFLRRPGIILSFDNLALEQLQVREMVPPAVWTASYMGDDGRFTMYLDAVRDEFAVSSTALRQSRDGRSVREMFQLVGGLP